MQKVKVSPAGCLILLRICVEYCLCRTDFWSHLTNKLWDIGASLVAQLVKNLPAMQDTWVLSLGWEDPLEKEKATHSSILA